jgi:transposase InsO family protein
MAPPNAKAPGRPRVDQEVEALVAGVTPHPDTRWMLQMARNITMEQWGFLAPGQYLIHDRDGKYCPAFQHIIDAAGVTRVPLPPRSPHLNAYAERWVRSVKEECLTLFMSTWSIIITRGIIKARATCSSFLRSVRTQSVQARYDVVNGLAASSNTTSARLHKLS